jgi:thioredoxin
MKMENISNYLSHLRGYNYTGVMPVVIDFYATWCGPCKALMPHIERLAKEYEGCVKVLKVDVDKNEALAAQADIRTIPTLFFIDKDGNIQRSIGGMPYSELEKRVEALLK